MGTLLKSLLNEARRDESAAIEPFKPIARYYPSMDFLLYLTEDCSYRGDRVDQFLTVLWHPYENRLVGIKLKGFGYVFSVLKSLLDLDDDKFLPLTKALEYLLSIEGVAESIIMQNQTQPGVDRLARYAEAKNFIQGATVATSEMRNAA